jgi:cytochrome P450
MPEGGITDVTDEYEFDLFDPKQTQHMWPLMAKMRADCPVASPAPGFYYTSRFSDTEKVFRDSQLFSCAGGFRAAGVEIPEEELFLAELDPPVHTVLRKFLLKSFNPGMARRAEPFARTYISGLFDDLDAAGTGNLVEDMSTPIPIAVTGHVLGVPVGDISTLAARIFALLHTDWPAYGVRDREHPEDGRDLAGSAPELIAYLEGMIGARRDGSVISDDLISQMIAAEVDGTRMSNERIRSLIVNFLSAGLSTTNLISNVLYRLITSQEFDARLRADQDLIPAAIEESLRFEPPVLFLFRTVKEPTAISEQPLDSGNRVVMGIASANRDESVYEEGERFRINRSDPEHLAFGAGPHLCLGNHMARMEGRVVVEEYLRRYSYGDVRLAPDYEYELMPHFLEYGPERLDVVVGSQPR